MVLERGRSKNESRLGGSLTKTTGRSSKGNWGRRKDSVKKRLPHLEEGGGKTSAMTPATLEYYHANLKRKVKIGKEGQKSTIKTLVNGPRNPQTPTSFVR